MKTLLRYITESASLDEIVETRSNAERRELLKEFLKGKYADYIEKLDEICEDPKAKFLLDDAFGGALGDTALKFSKRVIPVKKLMPSQNEIGLESSLKWLLISPSSVDDCFAEPAIANKRPIITFNEMFVIDGHHRWSEIYCANPDAKALCLNYDGDLTIIQMLKAMQGAIAAELGEVPVSKAKGANMYNCGRKEIIKYCNELLTPETAEAYAKRGIKDAVKYLANNCESLVDNHPVIPGAPSRTLMPQTDKGAELGAGGALARLRDGKTLKV